MHNKFFKMMKTICVEGNIGCGKTTFLNYLKNYNDKFCILPEPIDKWRNCNGTNLLNLLYTKHDCWAFPFQNYVMLTMMKHHKHLTTKPIKVLERSIHSARYCFVEILKKQLHPGMYSILDEYYNYFKADANVDLIIYMCTSPNIAYERIIKRSRDEEKNITIEYLQELHDLHEIWINNNTSTPVLVLNANLTLNNIEKEYERCVNKIIK